MACVSASDVNETDDIAAIDDGTIIESPNDVGTFKDLTEELNNLETGSKIELTRDYTYNSTTDTSYNYGAVNNIYSIEIDGKGHTLSGNNQANRILTSNRYDITIKNTIFTKSQGTAIDIYTGITLINCTFIDNNGEGINTYFGSLINCTFIRNTKASTICGLVENCTFINNTGTSGGALHTYFQSTIRNCTFENNTAREGGALYYDYPVTVENCRFINNKATSYSWPYDGNGAIMKNYDVEGTTYIINSTFINNTDPKGYSINIFGDWEIRNSTFINSAIDIDNSLAYSGKKTNANIEYSTFINCNLINIDGNLTLSKNNFENGYVKNSGTITTPAYLVVPDNSQQNENPLILLRVTDDNGNSIYDERIPEDFLSVKLENEDITLDSFVQIGGNWYYATSADLADGKYNINTTLKDQDEFNKFYLQNTLNNGTLEVGEFNNFESLNNTIASGSNIITLTKDYTLDIMSEFDYTDGIVIDKDNVVIDGAGHTINAATVARIFEVTGKNVTFKNINFINGYGTNGGAIYSTSDITIENCNFTGNKAFDGGAVYATDATIINSQFVQNRANNNGGAAYIKNKGTVKNSQFTANQAENGGAIYFEKEAVIDESKFDSNTANENGGAAYIAGKSDIANTEFSENSANKGGALYLLGSGSIDESTFTSNNATRGLAILNGALLNVANSSFDDQTDGKWDNEIVLILDGDAILDNVTPKELEVKYCVDLSIGSSIYDPIYYMDQLVYYIAAINDETTLNHGTVTICLNNTNYTCEIDDGIAIIPLFLDVGIYDGNISYYGGDKYESPCVPISFEIIKRPTKINNNQNYYELGVGDIYIASINTADIITSMYTVITTDIPLPGEKLIFIIDNEINVTSIANKDGVGVLYITEELVKEIGYGSHNLVIVYEGTENFEPAYKSGYINIQEGIAPTTIINIVENVTDVKEGEIYIASVTTMGGIPIVNETMIFGIMKEDGEYLLVNSTTNKDGVGVLSITPDLIKIIGNGTKNIVIYFAGNINHTFAYREVQINIISGNETPTPKTDRISENGTYIIDLKTDEGLPLVEADVNLTIGNTTLQNKTNENGTVTFNIPEDILNELKNGTQEATISYYSNGYLRTITKNITAKPEAVNTQITAKAATYVINYGGTYSVTLKDANGKALSGKTITFTLNGKNIGTAVTNANGVASIKLTASILKTAKAGSKNLVIKFNGDTNYNTVSKTVKIKINKEKTKIKAKKKTFKKAKKVKKYKITLKNSKGKAIKKAKVTLKIKGKTYKAKTNKKGKATFKIKKLTKKGKYKAKIKFKATANYLKATKKVKIKIK